MVKKYYNLTKPGIIFGNLISAAAGFFLAAKGDIDFWLLLALLSGTALIIGSACVFNNITDRDIDARMKRTAKRSLASGNVPVINALIFGTILGLAGYAILLVWVNWQAALVGAVGMVSYLAVYGWAKRNTWHSTLLGSIAGATPPMAGYVAVTGSFDAAAWLLFALLAVWQLPHFYALAIRLKNDYAEAGIPVISVVKGSRATKDHMVVWTLIFIFTASLLTIRGYTGLTYLSAVLVLGFFWLNDTVVGFTTTDERSWSLKSYFLSLQILGILCVIIGLNNLLP